MINKITHKHAWSMTLLRIIIGITFLVHGIAKLEDINGVIGFFGSLGLSAFFAYAVAFIETIAGAALILGFLTKIASVLIFIVIAGAIITVKFKAGFLGGFEYDLVLIASLIAIFFTGNSFLSIDRLIFRKKLK